jgi:hypothetical protein
MAIVLTSDDKSEKKNGAREEKRWGRRCSEHDGICNTAIAGKGRVGRVEISRNFSIFLTREKPTWRLLLRNKNK